MAKLTKVPLPPPPGGTRHPYRAALVWLGVGALFVVLISVVRTSHTIDAGDQGVVVCFGQVGATLDPGLHLVAPWCSVEGIDVRTQIYAMVARGAEGSVVGDDSLNVQSADSVAVKVDAAVIYHLDRTKARDTYTRFRPVSNVLEVIRNTSRRVVRDAAAAFPAEDLIGTRRAEFGVTAQERLAPVLAEYAVVLERVEIRDVQPTSETYKQAISAKVEQQQKAQAKQFELEAAEKDAQIKKVTAQADADAQAIRNSVPPAPPLLQQQYIDALRDTDNKVIVTDGNTPVLVQPPG